ncbi:MAG: DUF1109 domain-containing protein [Rhizomicrobium sp.]|nr:DUF1109 domain-containing protein [Rhizomicrobium sp.]
MKTDTLIARLAQNPAPLATPSAIFTKGLGGGIVVAFVLTGALLGFRHDFLHAMAGWAYWAKFAYTLALAIAGFVIVERLARPGTDTGHRLLLVAAALVLAAAGALGQWLSAPEAQHAKLFFGGSWRVCVPLIVLVSLPIFVGVIAALRQLAPTRPVAAGAAAGLLAGAAGAFVYGFHCNESALVFVSIWYSAGIAAMTALGAITGRWLLRW